MNIHASTGDISHLSITKPTVGVTTLTLFKPRLIAWGASGVVYKISDRLAVKRRVVECDEGVDFENEIRIYNLLESNPQCPYFVRSFYRSPEFNFLEFIGELSSNLHNRIKQHQINDRSKRGRCSTSLIYIPET